MKNTQLVPRTHIAKKMTERQEIIVDQIQIDLKLRTMAEAKHEYFENQDKYEKLQGTKLMRLPGIALEGKGTVAQQIADDEEKNTIVVKSKIGMTIENTKIGVTIVLSKNFIDCLPRLIILFMIPQA